MDQRILANSAIIQDFHYGPSGCADSNQNFHFGTQAASSVHLIASFAAVQSKLIFLSWSFSIYRRLQAALLPVPCTGTRQ
jgi:hypothetical protein